MILSIPFPQVVIPNMASEKEEKTNKMNFKQIKPIFWEVYEAKNAQAKRIMNICGQKCCKTIKTILRFLNRYRFLLFTMFNLPTNQPTYLPTYVPTNLITYPPTYLHRYLPT